jgi:hypothetical protein
MHPQDDGETLDVCNSLVCGLWYVANDKNSYDIVREMVRLDGGVSLCQRGSKIKAAITW